MTRRATHIIVAIGIHDGQRPESGMAAAINRTVDELHKLARVKTVLYRMAPKLWAQHGDSRYANQDVTAYNLESNACLKRVRSYVLTRLSGLHAARNESILVVDSYKMLLDKSVASERLRPLGDSAQHFGNSGRMTEIQAICYEWNLRDRDNHI